MAATNATSTLLPTTTTTTTTTAGLTGALIPFGGSALVGYIIGFALKKIVIWVLIILGVLAGIIFIYNGCRKTVTFRMYDGIN